ncbi:MAG: YggT family protein [Candidatus Zhuqueibacterota bacterium]
MSGLIRFLANIYILLIVARVLLSWVGHNPSSTFVKIIYEVTEPPLQFIRRYVPAFGGIDISPMILILAIYIIERILLSF